MEGGGRCELFCVSSPLLSGAQKEKEEWRGGDEYSKSAL